MVVQEPLGQGELAVAEQLRATASCYPRRWDIAQLLDAVGLGGKQAVRISTLSGGQRRRLDVALGIVGRPDLLLLDEPTTGLDPEARREVWRLVRLLAGQGTTILLTTHYLEEAERLAQRVAVMVGGRIVALDTPAALGGPARSTATVRWSERGERRSQVTRAPARLVAELARRQGGDVPDLTVTRPTLEDVYLHLIGAPL